MSSSLQEKLIPQQRAEMMPRCQLEKVEIVGEFRDEGKSGGGMKKRDGFLAALECCQREYVAVRPVDCIVCYDTSRFSRVTRIKTAFHIDEFLEAGVCRVLTGERWFDFRKEEDRVLFLLQQDFTNNRYLRDHAKCVTRGKKDHAEAAYANGGLPYGFDRLLVDEKGTAQGIYRRLQKFVMPKGGKVLPIPIPRDDSDPDKQLERQTGEFIFRTFATQDMSRWAISHLPNERNVPGPGSRPGHPAKWGSESVGAVLANPLYAGDHRWAVAGSGKYYRLVAGTLSPAPAKGKPQVNPDGGIFRPDAYYDYCPSLSSTAGRGKRCRRTGPL